MNKSYSRNTSFSGSSDKFVAWSGVSETVATGNADAIMAMLFESARTKKIFRPPALEIPLDKQILLPEVGGFVWDCPQGFKLRPRFAHKGGFISQADLKTPIPEVTLSGLTIEPEVNPQTGQPYEGNGFVVNLRDSVLPGLRVENYWNDQAFLIALYNCKEVNDWYFYTEQVAVGTGGIRLVGGADTTFVNASGQSGDDGVQFVPINAVNSPLFNLRTERCKYVGGTVVSTIARSIAAIVDTNVTEAIVDCAFTGIQGKASNRGVIVTARNGPIKNLVIENCFIDMSNDIGTQPEAVLLDGDVENSRIEVVIQHQPRRVLTVTKYDNPKIGKSFAPKNNAVKVVSQTAPRVEQQEPAVQLKEGVNNRVQAEVVAPREAPGVFVGGGTGFKIEGSRVRGVAPQQSGIRFAAGEGHDATDTIVEGEGNPMTWSPELESVGRRVAQKLGMPVEKAQAERRPQAQTPPSRPRPGRTQADRPKNGRVEPGRVKQNRRGKVDEM